VENGHKWSYKKSWKNARKKVLESRGKPLSVFCTYPEDDSYWVKQSMMMETKYRGQLVGLCRGGCEELWPVLIKCSHSGPTENGNWQLHVCVCCVM